MGSTLVFKMANRIERRNSLHSVIKLSFHLLTLFLAKSKLDLFLARRNSEYAEKIDVNSKPRNFSIEWIFRSYAFPHFWQSAAFFDNVDCVHHGVKPFRRVLKCLLMARWAWWIYGGNHSKCQRIAIQFGLLSINDEITVIATKRRHHRAGTSIFNYTIFNRCCGEHRCVRCGYPQKGFRALFSTPFIMNIVWKIRPMNLSPKTF